VRSRADTPDAAQEADGKGLGLSQYVENQLVMVAAPKKGKIKN